MGSFITYFPNITDDKNAQIEYKGQDFNEYFIYKEKI